MSRYFIQRRSKPVRLHDWDIPVGNAWNVPTVPDHEAADTGLVDGNGDAIMRAPNPMGFVWTTNHHQGD